MASFLSIIRGKINLLKQAFNNTYGIKEFRIRNIIGKEGKQKEKKKKEKKR